MPKVVKPLILVLVTAAAAATFSVAPAAASPCSSALIRDWYVDGRIDHTYRVRCYREALREVPEDQIVYGTLRDDLNRALQGVIRGQDGSMDDGALVPGPRGPRSEQKDGGFLHWVSDKLGPSTADSIPIPLLVLGGLALLLLAAAGASVLARRIQARRAEAAPAPGSPEHPR
jgi:hypothetical protein